MTMSNPWETPAAKKKEDYEDYDLSPPEVPEKERRTFDRAVRAINNDFNELRVEWESEEKRKVVWFKKRADGTEVELPSDFRRILLFLYSRNFKKHVGMAIRREAVKDIYRRDTFEKSSCKSSSAPEITVFLSTRIIGLIISVPA